MNCAMSASHAVRRGSSGRECMAGSPAHVVWDCTSTLPSLSACPPTRSSAAVRLGTAWTRRASARLLLATNAGTSAWRTTVRDCSTVTEAALASVFVGLGSFAWSNAPAAAQWSSSDLGREVRPVAATAPRHERDASLGYRRPCEDQRWGEALTSRRAGATAPSDTPFDARHGVPICSQIRQVLSGELTVRRPPG